MKAPQTVCHLAASNHAHSLSTLDTFLYLVNVVTVQRLRYAGLSSKGITICTLFKMMALGYRVDSNQKALFCEYRATCSVAERQWGSIHQCITQEMSVISRHEISIYQHFCIKN